jgi:hypothetical protein
VILIIIGSIVGGKRDGGGAPTAAPAEAAPEAVPAASDREAQIDRLAVWMTREEATETYDKFAKSAAHWEGDGGRLVLDSMITAVIRLTCVTAQEPRVAPPQNVHYPPRKCPGD